MSQQDVEQNEVSQDSSTNEEKLVPVAEAIRYRKRAQAAEKELSELKEQVEQQARELAQLKDEAEAAAQEKTAGINLRTQGVKETRTKGARNLLDAAAAKAARTGSRADIQEYLRTRRAFV